MTSEVYLNQIIKSDGVVLLDNVERMQLFSEAYDTYSSKIYGFILQQGHSMKYSEEILEKVFLEAWFKRNLCGGLSNNTFIELLKVTCSILKIKKIDCNKTS